MAIGGYLQPAGLGGASVTSGDVASGSITWVEMASGAVRSGHVGDAAVNSGNIGSGQIGNEHIADGTIIQVDIGSGAIGSGALASGSVSRFKMASGAISSGHLGSGAVVGAAGGGWSIASGTVGPDDLGNEAVFSGSIGSGQVGRFHVASGQLAGFELGSGAIVSGRIASGQVGNFHIASGQVQGLAGAGVPNLASGTVNQFNLTSGGVLSGHVGSGAIWGLVGSLPHVASGSMTGFELGSGAVVSGRVASGQLADFHFASGAKIDSAEWLVEDTYASAEAISGGAVGIAAAFTQSGTLQTAMASVSGRMPAVGVVIANVTSGSTVTLYRHGRVFSTVFNFSGWMNRPVYVGRSGQLSASGAPVSSGDIQQIMGVSVNQSGLQLMVGDALEEVIAASGDVGSGSITGQAGGGYFCVASGTLSSYDVASGMTVPRAQNLTPIFSGSLWNSGLITGETISGIRAVCLDKSGDGTGAVIIAMAAVSGRWPAIGIVKDNVLSGLGVNVYTDGLILFTSGLGEFSGFIGLRLWLARSGAVTPISGGPNSGGYASGDVGQPLGVVARYTSGMASGSFALLNVHPVMWSGGPLGVATGGTF